MVKMKAANSVRGFHSRQRLSKHRNLFFLIGGIGMMVAWTSFIVSITGSLGDDSTVLVEPSKKLDRSRRSLYPDQKSQTVQDGETTLRMQSANHSDASDIPELLIGEYRDPGVEFGYRFPMTLKDGEELPEPVQIVEDYMALHSADALRKNPDLENRRFIIAFFSCPYQAGHRLHDFLNVFMVAIMTNRTLLWKDWDSETCRHAEKYGRESRRKKLCALNNVDHCRQTLIKAPWIPMYDTWSSKLKLKAPHKLQIWQDEKAAEKESIRRKWRLLKKVGGVDTRARRHQVIAWPDLGIQFIQYSVKHFREDMFESEWSRDVAVRLHSWGVNFLYGMLQRYGYDMAEHLRPTMKPLHSQDETFSIGLHSRHANVDNDGCNISEETACIQQILANKTAASEPTTLSLMSDRQCTIDRLKDKFHDPPTFTALIADHDEGGKFSPEHGPYAGLGYFQDMALLSEVRGGFVGSSRSSTHLPLEWVEFYQKMEKWSLAKGGKEIPPDIPYCFVAGGIND